MMNPPRINSKPWSAGESPLYSQLLIIRKADQ